MKKHNQNIIKSIATSSLALSCLFGAFESAAAKPTIPSDGQRLYILGQDTLSIQEYMADTDLPRPNGFTTYTTLTRGATEPTTNYCFKGLDGLKNIDNYNSNSAEGCADTERRNQWGSGVQNAQWVIEQYNPEVVAIGMFCPDNSQAQGIAQNGTHDDLLDELASFFNNYTETKFFLRTCYEFNGDAHGLSGENFRAIYKHVKSYLDAKGVNNVAHVWQSDAFHGTGRTTTQALGDQEQGYWPGKSNVDWVGVSQFASDINEESEIAEIEGLPLFIAEVTPHGNLGTQYDYSQPFGSSQQVAQGTPNPVTIVNNVDWFTQKNAEIMRTSTKAWHWINADWTAQPQWESAADQAGANFFKYTDSRVQASTEIKAHFISLVSENNGFILANSTQSSDPVITNCAFDQSTPVLTGTNVGLSCDVSDTPEGLSNVDLTVNGVSYASQNNGDATYQWTILATDLTIGENTIIVSAADNAGNNASQTQLLTVIDSSTSVSIDQASPLDITRGSSANITVTANDADGIVGVTLLVNGVAQALDSNAPYTFTVNSEVNGSDVTSIAAVAEDSLGNITTSDSVAVNVTDGQQPQADFGIAYIDDNTMKVYHVDGGWTANFNYLCVNGDCRPGTREDGLFYREFSGVLGQSYALEFKVQDNVLSQYIVSETVSFEKTGTVNPPVNQLPSVSVTVPASELTTAGTLIINATASDVDGSIASVAFYSTAPDNNTEQLITTDTTSPYTASITNLVAGTYNIRVVATDNEGANEEANTTKVVTGTSTVNEKPTVSLEAIADITLGNTAGDNFSLHATASDIDGSVSAVAFYATAPNATELLISTDTTAPYSTVVTANTAGDYSFRIVATDNDGATSQTTSTANAKNSNQGGPTEDFGLSYVNDTTMRIYHVDNNWTAGFNYLCINGNCQAGINEGGIFYRDAPGILGQSYNLEFKVQDNTLSQYIVEKQNVTFTAGNTNTAPIVNLTATLDAEIVSLSATASDADGSVSTVKFYVTTPTANEVVVSNDSAAPFAASYTTTESGVFNFRAVATDDQGATSEDTTTINVASTEPAVSLSAPATINENETLTVTVALQNWIVEQGGTHYHTFIDGEDQGPVFHTNDLVITGLAVGSHVIEVKLAEADHSFTGVEASLSVDVQDIITSTVNVVNHPTLGNILVAGSEEDNAGFTLYTFDNDNSGQSVCEGGCATTWPALTVTSAADLIVPTGVTGLSTLARSDGTLQVTLNGENLYYFANDSQAGDVNGHGANGVWWAADITVAVSSFTDNTWQKSVVPACSDLYAGSTIPNIGYHIYTENNVVVFKAGAQFASNVWADDVRTVFFRNNAEGRLEHLGTVEGTRDGTQATMQVPSDWLQGKSVYYVSYERQVAPQQAEIGNALAYQDSALYGLNKSCVSDNYTANPEVFAGWVRFQHPQGFFNDHNVFNERIDPVNNSVGHFKNLPRFVATVLQDEPGQDLLIRVDLTYENGSTMSATDDITWAAIEGSELRAGGGSPRQQISLACEATDATYNSAICNLGQSFAYGQNIDWELRVIPRGSAGSNLYSQMLFYVKGHGWVRESVDPRATLGGYASIDAFGANVYERASSFMQHNHTDDLQMVRDFVEQHEDFRVPIGDDVNPGFHTCESCHVNDGRSQVVFDVPNVGLRIAPPLIGLGLLEKVKFAGKAGFGWEGNRENVEAAVRFALGADFGVTSPEQAMVDRLTNYSKEVAVPQRDKSKLFNADVIAGEALFKGDMQCAACHTETQITDDGNVIRPFSDLLTHDLGKGSFRTAPLWGIGRTPQVAAFSMDMQVAAGGKNAAHDKNQRESVPEDESTVLFMHDGSALGLDAAVRAHNGEAATARAAYESMSAADREKLLAFLRSL